MKVNLDYISPQLRTIIEPAVFRSHKFEKHLGCRYFKNAFVGPYFHWDKSIGCVIDEAGKVVKDSECIEWREDESYYKLKESVREHKKVIFLGFLINVFGHSYTDDLRKFWFLETEECASLLKEGAELVYTTSWNKPLSIQLVDMFCLAGYHVANARNIVQLTQFDEVVVPDNSYLSSDYGRLYCDTYAEAIKRIINNIPEENVWGKKIYFSRTSFSKGKKKEYGEKAIERVFRKLGYVIVFPEEHSIIEQIQMLRQCDTFAATEGSVAHLSLFCKPKTKVVIINKAGYLNYHQMMINEYADLDVTYVEAHHSVKADKEHPWWGPFYLCVNRELERFVGYRIPHLPYWLLPSYWEYTHNILYRSYNRVRKLIK